jgi:hypothetical protein
MNHTHTFCPCTGSITYVFSPIFLDIMKVRCNSATRRPRTACRTKCFVCTLLFVCFKLTTFPSCILAFQSNVKIASHHKVLNNNIDSITYINRQTYLIWKSKSQSDDDDDHDDDETPTNSQRRLSRVRNRVKELARKMVQVPIHVASSITPMPQAVAAVLKDATLNAVDLAVEEGMYSSSFRMCVGLVDTNQMIPTSTHIFVT